MKTRRNVNISVKIAFLSVKILKSIMAGKTPNTGIAPTETKKSELLAETFR